MKELEEKLNNVLGYLTAMAFDKPELADTLEHPLNELSEATELVNNFALDNVSKRYYWLKADGTISNMWDEKTHKETIDDEMMEIAKQKGWQLIQINVC